MQDSYSIQQAIEERLEQIWAAGVTDTISLQEQFGPAEAWQMTLGDFTLLLNPVRREWYYYDRINQAWAPSGLMADAGRFVLVAGRLGVKIHAIPDQPHLEVRTPAGDTLNLVLHGRLLIGSDKNAGLVLEDEQVSRSHAVLELTPDGWRLTDLLSANGTWVNGKPVEKPVLLKTGDIIQIAGHLLTFRNGG